jgi:hypothetical protein
MKYRSNVEPDEELGWFFFAFFFYAEAEDESRAIL